MQPVSSAEAPRARTLSSRSPATRGAAAQAPALDRSTPGPANAALDAFRARFDRVARDAAGQRGFFLNLLL